jgi:CBS domain containing-hemolysin-like protein
MVTVRSGGCRVFTQKKETNLEEESAKGFRHWLKMCLRRLAKVDDTENIEKEIQQLIDEGEQQGLISEDEGEMIQGIFSFRDTIAREIMVPRTDAVFSNAEARITDIVELIIQSGHSRIPIYQENIDNIIGTVHAKDLLGHCEMGDRNVRDMVRPPYFIPETKKISEVLKDLRDNKSHLAVVIDEYGGTAGILTLEDIIEEIIGDVMDEYDAEEKLIVEHEDGSISVNARLDVEELEDYLNVELPEGKFESVGGFVISLLGKVPGVNERLKYNDLEMVIEAANSRKIEKIRIRKSSPDDLESPFSEGVSY